MKGNPTIGETFILKARSQYEDEYSFTATQTGWEVRHGRTHNGNCDAQGQPHLYNKLRDNHLIYPSDLGFHLELIHEHCRDGTKTREEVQVLFDSVSEYLAEINSVERPEIE
jgi:hypothetical protein